MSILDSSCHFYPRFYLWSCLRSPSSSRSSNQVYPLSHFVTSTHASTRGVSSNNHQVPVPRTKSTLWLISSFLLVELPPLTIKFPFPKPSQTLGSFSSRLRLVSPLSKSVPPVPSSIPPQNSEITLQLGQRKN